MTRILITCRQMINVYDHFETRLKEAGCQVDLADPQGQQLSEAELLRIIEHYDGVIAGDDEFTRPVLERASRLRVLSKWGVGTDGIDKAAAAERGIAVTNTPGVFDDEVADVTVAYLVLLARGLHRVDACVRAGEWSKPVGRSLAGAVLGIVGLGGIGCATARRALTMGMTVLGTDPSAGARARAAALGVHPVGFGELCERSDAIALNCPLTPTSHHLINSESLAAVRPGLVLVNTGRGALVDEDALVEALRSGHLAGAALDVYEREPLPADSPLLSMPEVILGSHNASNTREAGLRASAVAVENLLSHLGNES